MKNKYTQSVLSRRKFVLLIGVAFIFLFISVPLISNAASATVSNNTVSDVGNYQPLALTMFNVDINNLGDFFNRLFRVALIIGATLSVILIAIAGLQYMTTDAITGKTEGKERIKNALLGLLMLLGVWLFYSAINPNILNINFKLSPVEISGGNVKLPPKPLPSTPYDTLKTVGDKTTIRIGCGSPNEQTCQEAINKCRNTPDTTFISQEGSTSIFCSTVYTQKEFFNDAASIIRKNAIEKWEVYNKVTVIDYSYDMDLLEEKSDKEKTKIISGWTEDCFYEGNPQEKGKNEPKGIKGQGEFTLIYIISSINTGRLDQYVCYNVNINP